MNTFKWFKLRLYNIHDPPEGMGEAHGVGDRGAAFNLTLPREDEKIAYGLFYQDGSAKSYDKQDATPSRGHHPVKVVNPGTSPSSLKR